MKTEWSTAGIKCKADDGILTIELNKVSFGVELRSEAAKAVQDFANFIIASKAKDQELIRVIETLEGNTE